MNDEATVVAREPCPKCGSSDNAVRYADGHAHCFSQGCDFHESASDDWAGESPATRVRESGQYSPVRGDVSALPARRISEETCRKFGYELGEYKGKRVQIASYKKGGRVVAQKLRFANKDFLFLGDKLDKREPGLYGQHLWGEGGRRLVITEGEVDALSVSQAQGNKWPVVSVPNGAQSAAKAVGQVLPWVESFDEVVIMFDMDDPGQDAAQEVAQLIGPKAKVAQLPRNDANEMVKNGEYKELLNAIYQAKPYRPEGVVTVADLYDEALTPPTMGISYPWDGLTRALLGIHPKTCIALGAGTGVGKTDAYTQIMQHLMDVEGLPIGGIMLEQDGAETLRRIAGKRDGVMYHEPPDEAGYTQAQWKDALDRLRKDDRLTLLNHYGCLDWATIQASIRYMVKVLGVRHVFLDHLTALAAKAADARVELESLMADISSLVQELDFTLLFVSHLRTPDQGQKAHEEGGRVKENQFKGSRAIGFWAHTMLGLERDKQQQGAPTILRVLKHRLRGRAVGTCIPLAYETTTGRLVETDHDPFENDEPTTSGGDF